MALSKEPDPVLPFWAILLSSGEDIDEIIEQLSTAGFRIDDIRGPMGFNHTGYYRGEMGGDLTRYWVRGTELVSPGELAKLKLEANAFEIGLTVSDGRRRVNIDPGYIDRFAVMVATCKKLPASAYLGDGIYVILQLLFRNNAFDTVPWTYKDYADAAGIIAEYRKYYLDLRKTPR